MDLLELVLSRVDQSDKDACWIWRGQVSGRVPCPVVNLNHKRYTVLRVLWEWYTGEEIAGRPCLVRMCGNVKCVNPSHLAMATAGSLAAKMRAAGRKACQPLIDQEPHQNIYYLAGLAGFDLQPVGPGRFQVVRGTWVSRQRTA